MIDMVTLKATVKNGRLVMDEPAPEYAEGTELQLVVVEPEDEMDAEEQAALDASLRRSLEQVKNGQTRPAQEILRELRESR